MIKKISAILLLLCGLAHAETITGNLSSMLGRDVGNSPVIVKGYDLPQYYRGTNFTQVSQYAQLTNGLLNVQIIAPGRYDLNIVNAATVYRLVIGADDGTYDLSQVATNIVTFSYTNAIRGISSLVQPGTSIAIQTNNAGLPNEYIIISSTAAGGGGTATNAYQLQISGAGLVLSTNALAYIYTLSLNANLQAWAALSPSQKQDALGFSPATNSVIGISNIFGFMPQPTNNNLTLWGALATSAKQDHSANLDFWSGETIDGSTIVNIGGVISAITGGTGNVTGDSVSTDLEIPLFNGTTGKAIKRSGHFLGDYQTVLGFTPPTFLQVTQAINSVTLPLDALAVPGLVTGAGVDQNTNLATIFFRNNLTVTGTGTNGFYWLDGSGTGGGSVSGMVSSNYFVVNTNLFIWDVSKVQKLSLNFETNCAAVVVSNSWYLTNGEVQLSTWEDTNGTWKVTSLTSSGGLVRTNGNGLWRGTNASQDDEAVIRLDGTGTNVWFTWNTNLQPRISFTNSLASGGGGGVGGGGTAMVTGGQSTITGSAITGVLGFKFHVSADSTLVAGGSQMITGNTHNHTVYLEDGTTGAILAQTSPIPSSGANNTYNYSAISFSLVAGTTYALVEDETAGLDSYYGDDATLTTDANIVITTACYSTGGAGAALTTDNAGSHSFGQVNGQFTTP